KVDYIAPGEHKQIPLPAASGNSIQWAAINDYGGTTAKETQVLQ
ncbi:molecular chaperone, partial [Klebsiella oxytoca]